MDTKRFEAIKTKRPQWTDEQVLSFMARVDAAVSKPAEKEVTPEIPSDVYEIVCKISSSRIVRTSDSNCFRQLYRSTMYKTGNITVERRIVDEIDNIHVWINK